MVVDVVMDYWTEGRLRLESKSLACDYDLHVMCVVTASLLRATGDNL